MRHLRMLQKRNGWLLCRTARREVVVRRCGWLDGLLRAELWLSAGWRTYLGWRVPALAGWLARCRGAHGLAGVCWQEARAAAALH